MFEPTSRYAEVENATLTRENGQVIVYKRRRFLPSNEKRVVLREVVVAAGDRLDLIAASVLGDPEQFWRICDANDALYPFDLVSEPGRILRVAVMGK